MQAAIAHIDTDRSTAGDCIGCDCNFRGDTHKQKEQINSVGFNVLSGERDSDAGSDDVEGVKPK